jgi:hypothetical protein
MGDYNKIMMQEQSKARQQYNYDPQIMMHKTRNFSSNIETFNSTVPTNIATVDPSDYTDIPVGSRADPSSVQDTPKTVSFKRYVIMDSSQRDWTKQPNPYTNLVFSFGSQSISPSNPPVYENNNFIPTFAVEQSNLPAPIPGLPNAAGWSLAAIPSNIQYPAYNSSLPKGNFIGYDTGYTIQPSGSGFGSVFTPCNVQAIRLVRAVLPQRQFLNIPIDPGTNPTDASTSLIIQSNIVGKPYATFSTYPYLMLYLNEYFGQYVGGNEPMRRSFSVMTQKQRQQIDFTNTTGAQQFDYEPWGQEALQLQSPITNLQRLAITVTDPNGNNFIQTDGLSVSLIQATEDGMFLKCFTGSFNYFSSNEVRVGDRVTFYSNTISNILKLPLLQFLNKDLTTFTIALGASSFPVLLLLDYVQDSNGIYVARDSNTQRTKTYVSSFNGFMIPNFITVDSNGNATPAFPGSILPGSSNVLELNNLIGSNIPFLNTTLQPVYTLEIDTLQPDTTNIGGRIVL